MLSGMAKRKTRRTAYKDIADFADRCPTRAEAARRLAIVPSYLTMLISGDRSPSLDLMDRAARLGIPMESWRKQGAAA
jgi:transcriptional regulator with XRE-family HTH domain